MSQRTLTLDTKIYKLGAIKAAAKDYSGIADVNVAKHGDCAIVTLEHWPHEYDKTIEYEFCNYVLWKLRN